MCAESWKVSLKTDYFIFEASIAEFSLLEREMLIQIIEKEPWLLKFIADQYKIQEMWDMWKGCWRDVVYIRTCSGSV